MPFVQSDEVVELSTAAGTRNTRHQSRSCAHSKGKTGSSGLYHRGQPVNH